MMFTKPKSKAERKAEARAAREQKEAAEAEEQFQKQLAKAKAQEDAQAKAETERVTNQKKVIRDLCGDDYKVKIWKSRSVYDYWWYGIWATDAKIKSYPSGDKFYTLNSLVNGCNLDIDKLRYEVIDRLAELRKEKENSEPDVVQVETY